MLAIDVVGQLRPPSPAAATGSREAPITQKVIHMSLTIINPTGLHDPVLRMATIGVYGFDGESFLRRLRNANVRLLLDVRQRRGVRGPEYAWANSRRLQGTACGICLGTTESTV